MSPILQLAESYPSICTFLYADDRHFLIVVHIHFWFLPDTIGSCPTDKFKPNHHTSYYLILARVRAVTWCRDPVRVQLTPLVLDVREPINNRTKLNKGSLTTTAHLQHVSPLSLVRMLSYIYTINMSA